MTIELNGIIYKADQIADILPLDADGEYTEDYINCPTFQVELEDGTWFIVQRDSLDGDNEEGVMQFIDCM